MFWGQEKLQLKKKYREALLFLIQDVNSVEGGNKNSFLARPGHHLPGFRASQMWQFSYRVPLKLYGSQWLLGDLLPNFGKSRMLFFYVCLWFFSWGWVCFALRALTLIKVVCWEIFAEICTEVQPHREVSIHTSLWAHCKHPAGNRKHFLCPRITCLPIERELMFPDGAYGCGRGTHVCSGCALRAGSSVDQSQHGVFTCWEAFGVGSA